ncbi:hypothetical protein A2U01_0117404, partial [Trifolium medium]|nr:hypothetical protein [Trifolium medium]
MHLRMWLVPQAKVDFVVENTEGVKDNVVPGTPENATGPEKD